MMSVSVALPIRRDMSLPRRVAGDTGSTSLAVALLTPVFVALAFAAWQAALWSHARTEARVVARDTAALVARSETGPDEAAGSAQAVLTADTSMTNIDVNVNVNVNVGSSSGGGGGTGIVIVTITANAPGIMRGTSRPVSVTVAIPIEEITPP
jgi:hypothetical protein